MQVDYNLNNGNQSEENDKKKSQGFVCTMLNLARVHVCVAIENGRNVN